MFEADQFLSPEFFLFLLLLVVTIGVWIQLALLRTRLTARLTRLEERLNEQEQLVEMQLKGSRELAEISDRLVQVADESTSSLEALRRDVVRLSDDVRGEVGTSRAIELARAGATKEAVADATGLSLEEAEAIVTFHGRNSG
jgi:predicted Holliday junction resolvase-like endonuclease